MSDRAKTVVIILGCGALTAGIIAACNSAPPISTLSDDQVIAATHKCESAGLRAVPIVVELFVDNRIERIECWPR